MSDVLHGDLSQLRSIDRRQSSGDDLAGSPPAGSWSDQDSGEENIHGDSSESKKRKRPMSVSCEVCKQRKVRCDRGHPICGWCARNGHVCEYKERKKPGLRAGYGKELEGRLEKLEDIIQEQGRLIEIHLLGNRSIGQESQHERQSPVPTNGPMQNQSPSESTNPTLMKAPSISQASPQASYGATYAASQPGSTPGRVAATSYLIPADASQNGFRGNLATPGQPPSASEYFSESPRYSLQHENSGALTDPASDLPPYDLLYALVDLYFKHINTWCPILHRKSTLDSLFGPSALDDSDRIILHAIVATSLRYSSDARLTADARRRYHDLSKQKVLLYGLENSNVKSLQALVILALDIVGTSNGPPGWNLLALLTRSVVQLGLAVETTSSLISPNLLSIYTLRAIVLPEATSWIEDESRRRLFWMIYLLDRYSTLATAFEFALDEREIDRRLPCRDDLFSRNQPLETRWFRTTERNNYSTDHPENLGSFSYYCEVLGILSSIHQFLKRPVDIGALEDVEKWQGEYRKLDGELNTWKYSLPNEFGNGARLFQPNASKQVNCMWVMLHVTYHTAIIRLHSSAAYPTTRSPIFTPSYSAMKRCLAAVDAIVDLTRFVNDSGMLDKLGPPFAFSLWVCSRLLLVHGSTIDHRVNPEIHLFVNTLAEMGRYWKVAEGYTNLLTRVLDDYQQTERNSDPTGPPMSMHILADMRRTAFDLDFLISHQPRVQKDTSGHTGLTIPTNTPSRTPAPNELEYLDVFDFFNMPRLPITTDTGVQSNTNGHGLYENNQLGPVRGAHNITDYMLPTPDTDWFLKS